MAGSLRPMATETLRRGGAAAEATARAATRSPRPWLQRGARLGYASSGVVYVTLGLIALQAARHGGETEDTRGAIGVLADKPGGVWLVTLVGIGLLAYAVWRLIEAATGAEGEE